MPHDADTPRLTLKQERFVEAYIEHKGNASAAYREAYDAGGMKPESVNRNAKALMDRNKIATRISELQEAHRELHKVNMASITAELEAARQKAMDIDQPSAAVSASLGKAKVHGLIIDKSKTEHSGNVKIKRITKDMTPAEAAQAYADTLKRDPI